MSERTWQNVNPGMVQKIRELGFTVVEDDNGEYLEQKLIHKGKEYRIINGWKSEGKFHLCPPLDLIRHKAARGSYKDIPEPSQVGVPTVKKIQAWVDCVDAQTEAIKKAVQTADSAANKARALFESMEADSKRNLDHLSYYIVTRGPAELLIEKESGNCRLEFHYLSTYNAVEYFKKLPLNEAME